MKICSDVLSVGNASPVINSSVVVIHRIGHLYVLGCSLIHLNLLEPVRFEPSISKEVRQGRWSDQGLESLSTHGLQKYQSLLTVDEKLHPITI